MPTPKRLPPHLPVPGNGLLLTLLLAFLPVPVSAQLPGGGGPDSPLIELQRGIGLLRAEKFEAARDHFTRVAEKQRTNALPLYYLALAHAALGDTPETLAALDGAVARGWEDPASWRADPGLAPLAEKDAKFREGLDRLLDAIVARRDRGVIPRRPYGDLHFVDAEGNDRDLTSHFAELGAPLGKERLAVLFLRSEGIGISALWALQEALATHDDLAAVILVRCEGKFPADRLRDLDAFRDRYLIEEIPVGISDAEQRRSLAPWHEFPTLLLLDRTLHSIGVVDGLVADLEERYAEVLARRPSAPQEASASPAGPGEATPPPRPAEGGEKGSSTEGRPH